MPALDHYITRDFSFENPGAHSVRQPGEAQNGNKGVIPVFFKQMVEDVAGTAKHGTPKYLEQDWVRFIMPGDKYSQLVRTVSDTDKVMYAKAWDAYVKLEDVAIDGTPLENWPSLSRAQIMGLKAMDIYSVEHVAELSDAQLQGVGMGARALRKRAQDFLATIKLGAVPERMNHEMEALREQNAMLLRNMATLNANFAAAVRKAGGDVTLLPDTEQMTRTESEAPKSFEAKIVVPDDFRTMKVQDLLKLAKTLTIAPVRNREEAIEAVEEYLGTQSAKH